MVEVRTVLVVAMAAALTGACTLATDHVDPGSPDDPAGGSAADAAPVGGGDPADAAPVATATGLLTVAASTPQVGFGEPIELSGDADWVHWGLDGDVAAYNHRAGITPSISNYVQLGDSTLLQTNCCIETGFSWNDGTPSATATNAIGGVYIDTAQTGDGFQFSVPADSTQRTLLVYAGNWCVREKLQATLSDGSAPAVVDTSFDVPTAKLANAIYTITFQAGAAGQTLDVALTIVDNHCTTGDVGEVHLFAAAVR